MIKVNVYNINFAPRPIKHRWGNKMSGVYKIIFDNSLFYIGSSKDIGSRISQWEHTMRRGVTKFPYIDSILPTCKVISYEIVEPVVDLSVLKVREDFHINSNRNNIYLLNKNNVFATPKIKKERKPKIVKPKVIREKKIVVPKVYVDKKIKIAKFSLSGEFICSYESMSSTVKDNNITESVLYLIFKGKRKSTHGFIFKKMTIDGIIIENNIREVKKRGKKKGQKYSSLKRIPKPPAFPPKKIEQYDTNGKLVNIFSSINDAAKQLNMYTGNICKVLKGKAISYHGYKFKYA